jgi:hypothetical protein
MNKFDESFNGIMNEIRDEDNPEFLFSTTTNKLLVDIVNGKIDPIKLAHEEMAKRGIDMRGKHVGFDKAYKLHGVR